MSDSFLVGSIEPTDEIGDSLDTILSNFDGLDEQLVENTNYLTIIKEIATWDQATLSLIVAGTITATTIYNSVYNDLAEFNKLDDILVYGKAYYDDIDGAKICYKRCQMGVIGIASDTYGFCLGNNKDSVPIGLAGVVLAHVDEEYEMGTPLTNDENGNLTKMTDEEKIKYPERLLATYKCKENNTTYGKKDEIIVNDRHWVRLK